MNIVERQVDPYMVTPPEDKSYEYGAQIHLAAVAHMDLRFTFGDQNVVNGITLAVARPGMPRPDSIAGLRKLIDESKWWKINFKTGDFALRRRRGGIITETYLLARDKKQEPKVWLTLDNYTVPKGEIGATENLPGYIVLIDKGEIEYGFQQSYSHEYFLKGKTFNGRYVFRLLEFTERQPLPASKPQPETLSGLSWIFIKTKNQTPYVLSLRAVQQKKLPPFGISALPRDLRKKVPAELQYWDTRDKNHAHEQRIELRRYFMKNEIIEAVNEPTESITIPDSIISENQLFELAIPNGFWMTKQGARQYVLFDQNILTKVKHDEEVSSESVYFFLRALHSIPKKLFKLKGVTIKRLNIEERSTLVSLEEDNLIIYTTSSIRFNKNLLPLIYSTVAFHFAKTSSQELEMFNKKSLEEGGISELAKNLETHTDFVVYNFAEAFRLWKDFKLKHSLTPNLGTINAFYSLLIGE